MPSSSQQKIPRPPNAFLIYRSFIGPRLPPPPAGTARNQRDVSKIAGEMWRDESPEVKDDFFRQAALAKAEHASRYPDYKFGCTPKSGTGGSRKGKHTQGEAVVDAPEALNVGRAVGGSQRLHYSPAMQEPSGNGATIYPDYCEAVFDYYPPLGGDFFNDFYFDHHDAGFDYYPPPGDESIFCRESAWSTNEAQLPPQTVFGDEQELVLRTLQGLSYEQLMEL
ncbi:hypothetical protein C0989_009008 [Termitomyces sp. Mn162]|nr:hypothetical protein C0989_009008 [Termitomyces sp. Mn162]